MSFFEWTYDYVVVGSGRAGLAVTALLSEDPQLLGHCLPAPQYATAQPQNAHGGAGYEGHWSSYTRFWKDKLHILRMISGAQLLSLQDTTDLGIVGIGDPGISHNAGVLRTVPLTAVAQTYKATRPRLVRGCVWIGGREWVLRCALPSKRHARVLGHVRQRFHGNPGHRHQRHGVPFRSRP